MTGKCSFWMGRSAHSKKKGKGFWERDLQFDKAAAAKFGIHWDDADESINVLVDKKEETMKRLWILGIFVAGAVVFLVGCGGGSLVKENSRLVTKVSIDGNLFVNPIEDATPGQAVDKIIIQEIHDAIISRIKGSGRYTLTDDKSKAKYILNIRMVEFNAGNRALRFWVGLGAGSAKLHFICRLIDANGRNLDEQHFQRFGAASLRSGPAIIEQMKSLTINYACGWLKI